jgi:hypothetical protein
MIQTPCRHSPQRNNRQPEPVVTKTVARSYTTSWDTIAHKKCAMNDPGLRGESLDQLFLAFGDG